MNDETKAKIRAAQEARWAKTKEQKSKAAIPLAKIPLTNSPVSVKGTWDGVRYWLNAAKAFEQGKLFSQVMVGFELLALHKAFGISQGKRSDLVPHHFPHAGGSDANSDSSTADSWEELCKREAGIGDSTGYRYMDMAKTATPRLKQLPGLKNFNPFKRSLSKLKPAMREELQSAVKKLTDGKSQGEFFDDLYKQKSGGTGREPGCDGTKKKLTLSEEAALRQQEAAQDWTACDRQLWAYKDKFTVLTDTDVTAQIARLEQALNARNAWLKQPLNDRQPKLIADMFPL